AIWITLQGGELVVYQPETGKAKKYAPALFEHRTIRQVTEDSAGNLWFGTQHGAVIKWDYGISNNDPATGYTTMLTKTGLVTKLLTDNAGSIWVGTMGQGLLKLDPKTGKALQRFAKYKGDGQSLTNDVVTDLLLYNDHTVIAVTKSLNLIDTRTDRVSYITTAEGLPSNTGVCIEKDVNGMLWLGLVNGLCRININEDLYTIYNRTNGIEYDNFNPAGAFRLKDGRLVFATDHNILAFDPQQFIAGMSIPPDPEICSITVSDKMLSVDSLLNVGKAELDYDNSSVAIQFSILSFLKQKQPNYAYMLENFDKDWIKTNGTNEAVYSYLPPGYYVFKVKAVNQDGLTNGKPTEIAIMVNPPFWRSWWFYGIIALLGVVILYQIDKERQKKRRALQSVRTQIAGELHEEINVTLNDINLLSQIAKIKADKDIDRSKDYIDQISTKSRSMIESMDDILWSIQPENDSMEKMLLRIYEFTDGIKKTAGLEVELSVDKEVKRLAPDMKTRHEFLLFYKAALLYVIEHSVCSTIYISLEYVKSKLALKLLAQCDKIDDPGDQVPQLEHQMQRHADALNGMLDIMGDRKSISIILQMGV
ncbi:MAG TPA: triple tyrosine motif-containing protein, partial [Niastella sp.]|nr:triple tyrosine motif-containing protein [Niastella sp.]